MGRYGDDVVVIVTGWRAVGPVIDTNVRDDHLGVVGASLDSKALLSLHGIEEGERERSGATGGRCISHARG